MIKYFLCSKKGFLAIITDSKKKRKKEKMSIVFGQDLDGKLLYCFVVIIDSFYIVHANTKY